MDNRVGDGPVTAGGEDQVEMGVGEQEVPSGVFESQLGGECGSSLSQGPVGDIFCVELLTGDGKDHVDEVAEGHEEPGRVEVGKGIPLKPSKEQTRYSRDQRDHPWRWEGPSWDG